MGVQNQAMCSRRFVLLLMWCGLLSVAMVVLSVTQLTARQNPEDQCKHKDMQQNEPKSQLPPSSATAGRPLSHIHLTIKDSNLTLNDDIPGRFAGASRTLVLRNNSVYVTTGGFYHFYAQVTFGQGSDKRTVTLISNAIPGQWEEKALSQAVGWGDREGSISTSQTIRCRRGQSLRLEIEPRMSLRLSVQNTYWGLFLLMPHSG